MTLSSSAGEPPATPSDVCPYRGLTPFGVDDEDEFFGRDDDIDAALGRLARSPFLAVTGASGSGKSSLVRAGLVPVLRRRGGSRRDPHSVERARRGDQGAILRAAGSAGRRRRPVRGAVPRRGRGARGGRRRARSRRRDRARGIRHPRRALRLPRRVRRPARTRSGSSRRACTSCGPMAPDSLRDAIEHPARRAGLRLEPGLTELILRDATGGSGSLPHVSHALVETWLRREGGTLTVAGYEASGGISGAIAQSADRLYQSLDATQRDAVPVHACTAGRARRRRQPGAAQSPVARAAEPMPPTTRCLSLLADARLVSTEADSVAVAHESLAIAWPRLHAWLEEDAESSRTLATLSERCRRLGMPTAALRRTSTVGHACRRHANGGMPRRAISPAPSPSSSRPPPPARRANRRRSPSVHVTTVVRTGDSAASSSVAAGLIVLLVGAGSVAVVASGEAGERSVTPRRSRRW